MNGSAAKHSISHWIQKHTKCAYDVMRFVIVFVSDACVVVHLFSDNKAECVCIFLSACKPNWIVHLFAQVSGDIAGGLYARGVVVIPTH